MIRSRKINLDKYKVRIITLIEPKLTYHEGFHRATFSSTKNLDMISGMEMKLRT